jgi:purine-binding chemotaxis protein CheW
MSRELQIVGFKVGRETYGVPIQALHEIVRMPEITAVPDAPPHLEGVINLRGKIVPVIDLRKRFGESAGVRDRKNRILVVEHRGGLSGLIVDSASEVLKIPETEMAPPIAGASAHFVTGLGKRGAQLIIVVDVERLLGGGQTSGAAPPAADPETKGSPR